MKFSKIFRIAAKNIDSRKSAFYACEAIDYVCGSFNSPAREYFKDLYGKKSGGMTGWYGVPLYDHNQSARVIALCFAAAIAESEGK